MRPIVYAPVSVKVLVIISVQAMYVRLLVTKETSVSPNEVNVSRSLSVNETLTVSPASSAMNVLSVNRVV